MSDLRETHVDDERTKFVLGEDRIPKAWYNIVADLPVPPAPVSVAMRAVPSSLLKNACAMAVLGLWLPAGLTPSYLK
jgi:hypothetical protein